MSPVAVALMRPAGAALVLASRPAADLLDPAVAWDLQAAVPAALVAPVDSAVDRVVAEAGAADGQSPHCSACAAGPRRILR